MDDQDKQLEDAAGAENGLSELSGVGAFLREEREKKGLSRDQIAEKTRLRRHIIEALENEDWDLLPQKVFVRGFIRTYSRALSLEEARALEFYDRTVGTDSGPLRPLRESGRSGKRVILSLLILFGIAVGIYLWTGYHPGKGGSDPIPDQGLQETAKIETPAVPEAAKPSRPDAPEPPGEVTPDPVGPVIEAYTPETIFLLEKEQTGEVAEEPPSLDETVPPAVSGDEHVLQGNVLQRTWVRIYVDDQEPKEYIFQPGSRPRWAARDGFRLVVGNAAGIEFEFDGKGIETLGNLGQVVRLSFPEGFRSEMGED